jgi:hypothetical protein
MLHSLILFGDVDWVRLGIFVVIAVAWVINFLANRLREGQAAKARPPRPERPKADTAKELEEFLKKTAARRDATAAKPPTAAPAPQARAEGGRTRAARRKADDRDKRRKAQPATATPSLVNLRESNLTRDTEKPRPVEPVHPSIDTRKFTERASHLGASHLSSLETDHSLEQHLKDTFSHQLGTLAAGSTSDSASAQNRAAVAAVATASRQALPIAALLRGGNARTAIVLNEILQRPADRW